jgi:hypothetical protein
MLGARVELEDVLLVAPLPTLAVEAAEIERELDALAPPEASVIRMKHFDGLNLQGDRERAPHPGEQREDPLLRAASDACGRSCADTRTGDRA